jgi:hypothetical protein
MEHPLEPLVQADGDPVEVLDVAVQLGAAGADLRGMEIVQVIVVVAAAAFVIGLHVRWVRERLGQDRDRLFMERAMSLVFVPIALGAAAVSLVFWWWVPGWVFVLASYSLTRFANVYVRGVRAVRRRRPVKPRDRQRRIRERAERRRTRAIAMERYGPRGSSTH